MMMMLSLIPVQAAAVEGSLSHFERAKSYNSGQFVDVPSSSAFADNVKASYEFGIMQGQSDSAFGLSRNISCIASLIVACRINAIYYHGADTIKTDYDKGSTQATYLAYAQDNGIYSSFSNWSAPIKRYEFALILSSALPDDALGEINAVKDSAIPDVPVTTSYANAVYRLYRAGILTGSDSAGDFQSQSYISRGAACAIATRMVDPSLRKTITLTKASAASTELNAEQVYAKCSSAVAYLEVYDANGKVYASGSGFFIDSDGTLVTCYHVIDGCSSAKVQTTDGKTYTVEGIYDYNKTNDWAVLKVNGSGFNYLTIGSSNEINAGGTVFAIGSPLGLSDSISQGIISSVNRTMDGSNYIQYTASISHGSSGGALINKFGHVIGITAASFDDSQNLNLAVPMTYVSGFKKSTVIQLSTLANATGTKNTNKQDRNTDIFNYLCWYIYTYSNTTVSGDMAVEYENGCDSYAIYYDTTNQAVVIRDMFTSDSGQVIWSYLNITKSLEPYFVTYFYYPSQYSTMPTAQGAGNISPYDFTDTSAFLFDTYSGGNKSNDAGICTLMIASTMQYLDWLLSSVLTDGYSIYDLGFYALYQQWH
jgi:Trypsin-like serine proteases, typically periplasmic, contain C-terminal PDZ domain